MLALPGIRDVVVMLKINEVLQAVSLGEAVHQPFAMFLGAAREIVGYTDV